MNLMHIGTCTVAPLHNAHFSFFSFHVSCQRNSFGRNYRLLLKTKSNPILTQFHCWAESSVQQRFRLFSSFFVFSFYFSPFRWSIVYFTIRWNYGQLTINWMWSYMALKYAITLVMMYFRFSFGSLIHNAISNEVLRFMSNFEQPHHFFNSHSLQYEKKTTTKRNYFTMCPKKFHKKYKIMKHW